MYRAEVDNRGTGLVSSVSLLEKGPREVWSIETTTKWPKLIGVGQMNNCVYFQVAELDRNGKYVEHAMVHLFGPWPEDAFIQVAANHFLRHTLEVVTYCVGDTEPQLVHGEDLWKPKSPAGSSEESSYAAELIGAASGGR